MLCLKRVRRRTWRQSSGYDDPGFAQDRLLVAARCAARSAAFVGGQRRHRGPKSSTQAGLAGIRLPGPGVTCRVARGFPPESERDRPVAGRYAAQQAAFVGGQIRHRRPKSRPQAASGGARLPRPVVICRSTGGILSASGPLKRERVICRERLRLLLSDREASGGRKSLIQKHLRPGGGLKAGVICRVARGLSGSLALRLLCSAA